MQAAPFRLVLWQRQNGRDGLALGQRQQVDHRPALGGWPAFGQAPHLHPINPAGVGEEQHRIVGRSDEQLGDDILVLGAHARAALAAALLLAEQGQRSALDVAGHGHGHDHVLDLDQILVLEAIEGGGDLGDARRCELGFDLVELLPHHFIEAGPVAEDFKQFADGLGKSFKLAANFVAAEGGQAMQAQFEDRFDLRFAIAGRLRRPACGSTASTSAI